MYSVVLELSVCLAFQLSWDSLHLRYGDNLPVRLLKQTVAELPCTCEGSSDSFFVAGHSVLTFLHSFSCSFVDEFDSLYIYVHTPSNAILFLYALLHMHTTRALVIWWQSIVIFLTKHFTIQAFNICNFDFRYCVFAHVYKYDVFCT